ncbi:MAG: flagellar FlbD family protein [Caldibacillus sp.]
MIQVTRLNGQPFYINALYIETVEAVPDTTIRLTNGKTYVVRESDKELIRLIKEFYKEIQILSTKQQVTNHEK